MRVPREQFLDRYSSALRTTLPEQIDLSNRSELERLLQTALLETIQPNKTTQRTTELKLAQFLANSQWCINGNIEKGSGGIIAQHPIGIRDSMTLGDVMYCGWSFPRNSAEYLPQAYKGPRSNQDLPVLVHAETEFNGYIFFSYGTRAPFDGRAGYGIGHSISTDKQSYQHIIQLVRNEPKKVFQLFRTLSDDRRITPPLRHDILAILPLQSAKNGTLQNVEYIPLNYNANEQHLHTWPLNISEKELEQRKLDD